MKQHSKKSSSDKILYLIKTGGPKTAATLAKELNITSMGARQHLQNLTNEGLIEFQDIKQGRGRPARYWKTTKAADSRFPDAHSSLTLQLLSAAEEIHGEQGVNEIIAVRQKNTLNRYQRCLEGRESLADKLQALVEIRSEDGYMADVEKTGNGYILNENHCPICTAATENKSICNSELGLFRKVLGEQYQVERVEHILADQRRCSYQITIQN